MGEMIIRSSLDYHKQRFSLLTTVEKERALRKLKRLLEMQVRNGIKLESNDNSDDKGCAKIEDITVLVVQEQINKLVKNCHFMSLSSWHLPAQS